MARNLTFQCLRGVVANIPTLAVGELYFATDTLGLWIGTASGNLLISLGRWNRITVLTSSSTFTVQATTSLIHIRVIGGGGAGGGCTGATGANSAAGGGGGAGGYTEDWLVVLPNHGYIYTIGAGGTGVAGSAGNPGTSSVWEPSGSSVTWITALGGKGGINMAAGSTAAFALGGAPSDTAAHGHVLSSGSSGEHSIRLSGTVAIQGSGASGLYGSGGQGIVVPASASTTGTAAVGFGGGGGGSSTQATATSSAGGAGAPGVIIVEEYS